MNASPADPADAAPALIPVEQIVQEVYACADQEAQQHLLAQLVGRVYETAPPPVRSQLLVQLLRPMGVLSLMAVANGVFAKIRFRSAGATPAISADDLSGVHGGDVVALVERMQQISTDNLHDLARWLAHSPAIASSGAAAVLAAILLQSLYRRRAADRAQEDNLNGLKSVPRS